MSNYIMSEISRHKSINADMDRYVLVKHLKISSVPFTSRYLHLRVSITEEHFEIDLNHSRMVIFLAGKS